MTQIFAPPPPPHPEGSALKCAAKTCRKVAFLRYKFILKNYWQSFNPRSVAMAKALLAHFVTSFLSYFFGARSLCILNFPPLSMADREAYKTVIYQRSSRLGGPVPWMHAQFSATPPLNLNWNYSSVQRINKDEHVACQQSILHTGGRIIGTFLKSRFVVWTEIGTHGFKCILLMGTSAKK